MNLTYTINFEPIIRWYTYGLLFSFPTTYYVILKYYKKQKYPPNKIRFMLEVLAVCLASWITVILFIWGELSVWCITSLNRSLLRREFKGFYILNTLLTWIRKDSVIDNKTYVLSRPQMKRHLDNFGINVDMAKVNYVDIKIINRLCGSEKVLIEDLLDEEFFRENRHEYWVWENVGDTLKYAKKRLVSRFNRRYPNKYFYFSFSRLFWRIKVRRLVKKAKTDKERKYYERTLEREDLF